MITLKRLINPSFLYLLGLVLSATLFLNSCGGGAAAFAGVGSGGTGVIGTVTGFASLIIDGKDYPYTTAPSVTQTDINSLSSVNGVLSLGQVVQANYDSVSNNLNSVTLLPELEGPVTVSPASYIVNNGDYIVTVLGQPVRLITNVANTSLGVSTVIYDATNPTQAISLSSFISSLTISSTNKPEVVVYGMWVLDTNLNQYVLNATRIELTSTTTPTTNNNIELSGIATSAISAGQNVSFTLNSSSSNGNNYGIAILGNVSSAISQYQIVRVIATRTSWCSFSSTGCPQSGNTTVNYISAYNIANISLSPQANQTVQVAGLVTYYDSNQHIAYVQGVPIKLTTSVNEGDYISSNGVFNGELSESGNTTFTANNSIKITSITNGINFNSTTTLNGVTGVSLTLQGISVFAPSTIIDSSCANLTATSTEKIVVTGTQSPGNPVNATRVTCTVISTNTNSSGTIVDYSGTVTTISGSSFQLSYSSDHGATTVVQVSYNSNTYLASGVQIGLSQSLEIQGVLQSDGSVLATAIKSLGQGEARSATND